MSTKAIAKRSAVRAADSSQGHLRDRTTKARVSPAPRVSVKCDAAGAATLTLMSGETGADAFLESFGTTSADFAQTLANDVLNLGCEATSSRPHTDTEANAILAAMHGIAPRDELEGMLAAQMLAVHTATMRCLAKFKFSNVLEEKDANAQIAVKLARTFTMQIEALQRYRGAGQQKVTVEHVHVHSGGQAIVGEVRSSRGGVGTEENDGK